MAQQYLDQAGLQELVKKTKEYARKSAKDAVVKAGPGETSGYGAGRTIIGWNDATSAAIYGDIAITSAQVTNLADAMALKADLDSPEFQGTPTVPTPVNPTSGSHQIANVEYVLDVVGNIGEAMHYKGVVNQNSDLPSEGYAGGDTYKVATAGTYAGKVCEVGDMIIANKAYAQSAVQNDDWDVIQTNIDGAVTGPAAATSGHFALFDNANGKVIADAGYGIEHLKTKQSAVSFTSGALQTVNTISQDANGEIAVTFQDIQSATTEQKGVVQLAGSIGAEVASENNKAATEKAVRDAINALDVSDIAGFGADKTLSALSETGGKISASFQSIQIEKTAVNGLVSDLTNIATSAANLKSDINVVSGALVTSAAALDAKINTVSGLIDNLDAVVTSTGGYNVEVKVTQTDGKITGVSVTKDNTITEEEVLHDIEEAIKELDVNPIISTSGAAATITSISEEDGKISATYSPIAITSAQVTDLGNVLGNYKTVQTAVSDPSASGNALSFIDSISQDANGVITPTKKSVTVDSTYSSAGTNPVNGQAIAAAIGTLDVTAITSATSATITSILETDGLIDVTYQPISISVEQVNDLTPITSATIDSLFNDL